MERIIWTSPTRRLRIIYRDGMYFWQSGGQGHWTTFQDPINLADLDQRLQREMEKYPDAVKTITSERKEVP